VRTAQALKDQELMPEGKDLCLEFSPSSKALPNRRKQHENDREHVACKLQLSPFKLNGLNENGVFGRDRWQETD
jgi:hypothetical protein